MNKHLSCSFHSNCTPVNTSDISVIEKSILKEYERLKGYQQTPQYSIDSLTYTELPKFFNSTIKSAYSQCIFLDRFTFYEMFTILIIEYLFKNSDERKMKKINNLKALICSNDFLEGNVFTKGLIIKGFKIVEDYKKSKDNTHPLGQLLLTCDYICAFTDCWKELVHKICEQNNIPSFGEDEIDSSIFQLFASYFHVNFDVYWKEKGNKFWKEHFTFQDAQKDSDTISLVVNPDYQISVSQRSIKITESRSSHLSTSNRHNATWNYILLTNLVIQKRSKVPSTQTTQASQNKQTKVSQKGELTNGQEISRISQIDYSCGETQQIKILLQDKLTYKSTARKTQKGKKDCQMGGQETLSIIMNTMNKANCLIEDMRQYLQELETLNTINNNKIEV